jgi:hypothetical protein
MPGRCLSTRATSPRGLSRAHPPHGRQQAVELRQDEIGAGGVFFTHEGVSGGVPFVGLRIGALVVLGGDAGIADQAADGGFAA